MRIGGIDLDERVLVVAEIGNNHEGSLAAARELLRAAADAGADAVKFQTFRAEKLVRASEQARIEQLRRFELEPEQFVELAELARELGLLFVSTPFDLESVAVLEPVVDAFKIASGDNDFYPLLDAIAATGKPVIASTGMSDLEDVRAMTARFARAWAEQSVAPGLAVLQCVSAYPTPPAASNLAAIGLLSAELGLAIGFSDHTVGIEAAPLAVAAGARIVEKHLTLDHDYSDFRDHKLAADPGELRELVARIRAAEQFLGRREKRVEPVEIETARAARRSIVAAADLPVGHVVTLSDLAWLRPGDGLRPGSEDRLLGRALVRDVRRGEPLALDDVS